MRVNALASGGLVPASMRGTTLQDWTAMEDLYVTYCGLAGVGTEDAKARAAGLPQVDGYDLWPLLSGANATGPRTEVWLGSGGAGDEDNSKDPIVQAYIRKDGYKVIWGAVIENTWTGPFYPNASTNWCVPRSLPPPPPPLPRFALPLARKPARATLQVRHVRV